MTDSLDPMYYRAAHHNADNPRSVPPLIRRRRTARNVALVIAMSVACSLFGFSSMMIWGGVW